MTSRKDPEEDKFIKLLELYREGEYEELIISCELLLKTFPSSAKLYNIKGVAFNGLSKFEVAIDCYNNALRINPEYAEAYNNLGNTFKIKGDFDSAIDSFKKAILLKPNFPEAHNNMGAAFQGRGDLRLAIHQYQEAINIKIDFLDAYVNKGNALRISGNTAASIDTLKTAKQLAQNSSDVFFSMGLTFWDDECFEDAIENFETAIKINPNHFEAYNFLGNALKSVGKTERAVRVFEKVLSLKDDFFEVHRHLAFARKYEVFEEQIQVLLNYLNRVDLGINDYININFALGKIYEDLKQYDKSFTFLNNGNRLRKKELKYTISDDIKLFNLIKQRFKNYGSGESSLTTSHVDKSIIPIFIIGMPRSGTTLIEQIVSSHSKVFGGGELNFLGQGVEINKLLDLEFTNESLSGFRSYYLGKLQDLKKEETFITDKMPLNFRWCGFILKAIPEARIIHVNRDRMATSFSLFKSYFSSSGNRYAYDLCDIRKYYNLYEELMAFWHKKFAGKIYQIDYEYLTEQPRKEIKALLQFIGVDWEDRCLDFHKNERPVLTLSKTQVRQKIYQGSSQNWKNYEPFLRDLIS